MIELRNVRKEFPEVTPLMNVTTTINEGDVISVIGPSGTGKSTLLRCINMLDPPTSGDIIFDGECITAKGCDIKMVRRKMGMVFQNFNLFGHLTVLENIMVPQMDLLNRSKEEARDKALELLKTVGLSDKALAYPDELSGGQKQRIAIVRTLAMDPEVILFDEPTSALDPTMVGEVETVIKELAKSGATMMIVTHEMKFAREVSNRVFYMDDGGIYEDGTPDEIFENPKKDKTRRFIKRLKVLELQIDDKKFDYLGMSSEIEEYCYRSQIDRKMSNKLRSCFEEVCKTILIPHLPDDCHVSVIFEYSANQGTTIETRYNGEPFSPMDTNDEIALKFFEANQSTYKHELIDESPYTNKFTITIEE